MACIELQSYRSYTLELREFGDTGWRVIVYAPAWEQRADKVAVISTLQISALPDLLAQGMAAVDRDCEAMERPGARLRSAL